MSGFFRAQVRLPRDGVTPEDDIVNVWHFDSDQSFADDADDVANRLLDFYQNIASAIFSPLLTGDIIIKMYDMADPEPRVPGFILTDTLGALSGTPLPAECAMCLSMVGAVESGVNMKRRRGRVYLGPLKDSILEVSGADVRITAAVRDAIVAAAEALATGPDSGDGRLAVYSPTNDLVGTLDDAFTDVVTLKIDNAVDIQRRRGARATLTSTATV